MSWVHLLARSKGYVWKKKNPNPFWVICNWSSHDETMNAFTSSKDEGRPHHGSQWVSQASHTAQDEHHPSFPRDPSCLSILIFAITGVSHQVWPITAMGLRVGARPQMQGPLGNTCQRDLVSLQDSSGYWLQKLQETNRLPKLSLGHAQKFTEKEEFLGRLSNGFLDYSYLLSEWKTRN